MISSKIKIISLITIFVLGIFYAGLAQDETIKLYKRNKKQWLKSFSESSSGLLYKIVALGEGKSPLVGDRVTVHYIGFFENDTVFDNSYKKGEPLVFNFGVGQVIKGWDEGLSFLKEGGKVIFKIPPHLAYGNKELGKIKPNSTLYFQVELLKVEPNIGFKQFNTTGLDTVSLSSGIKYIVVKNGQGEFIGSNHWIYMSLIGYLPSGKIFTSITPDAPIRYAIGRDKLPDVFDSILPLMKVGSQFHVITPAKYAYGSEGISGSVPPNSPVSFDIGVAYVIEKVTPKPYNVEGEEIVEAKSGLKYIVVEKGDGQFAVENDVVKIHFSSYLENGKMIQSSLTNDDDIIFVVGQNHVIEGLDELMKYMRVGSKVRALIPWQLGYGEEGHLPEVPPKTNLIIDVELVTIAE